MALTIGETEEADVAGVKADRRLYLTADKNEVVEDGDPRAAFLLAAKGSRIPDDYMHLLESDSQEEDFGEPEKQDTAEEPAPDADENNTEIRVEQNGSWYTGYRDGEQVFKVQGEDAMKAAVSELEG